ncbi:inactive peptidyl-prolyl cis-trans isomerase FKBP6 isoform X1 [Harpia harpyja]|uniref:inactive peptidyl-prolyl cis-trans isomerase FKBP6 isoform X1 n=1 Tax=Harpia harpyja TaxID=202280 RepID=UPI0022B0A6EA|nr:inactive peptidyl-prolyl cis-trans isomerase FKBP6 isoform X1 [Harpia harpyja]
MVGCGGAAGEARLGPQGRLHLAGQAPAASSFRYLAQTRGLRDLSGDGGVLKEELRPGTGQAVPPAASVAVKYSGYLEHWDEPFCTNYYSKFPGLMKLGKDITLGGLEIGLLTMKKGEVARFVFTPDYAYGRQGCPPLIPPNATVMFEVEVLDFLDSDESDTFFQLTAEQQDTFPLQKVLKVADTEREFGNYLYRKRHFEGAKDRYKRAFSILGRSPSSEAEQCLINASKLLVLLNLSLTYLKLERPAQALAYGEKALEIDQRNAKALFRCGQACLCMTEYEKARDFLVRAQHIQPFNHDINNELKKLASCYKDYVEKEKEMCCRMFAPLNSSSG